MCVFSGKEAEERLRGAWIIEVSELQGFARAEVENIKGFLSQQVDHYRPAYGRRMRDFPRECVFFGTTNVYNFQRDSTGGRRFWPIDIDKRERTKDVFEDLFAERDQLWAEAVCRYRSGEPLFISGEIKQTASDIQEEHRDRDEWEGLLGDFMNKPIPVDWESWDLFKRRNFLQGAFTFDSNRLPLEMRRRVSSIEFLCEYMGLDKKSIDKGLSRRVNRLLQSLTGWHRTEPYKTRLYGTVRGFEKD